MFLSSLICRYNEYSKESIHALISKKIRSSFTKWTRYDAYPVYMQSNLEILEKNWTNIELNHSANRNSLGSLLSAFIKVRTEEKEDLLHAFVVDRWRNETKLERHLTDSREF